MHLRVSAAVLFAALFALPLAAQTTLYEQPSGGASAVSGAVVSDDGWIYSENFTEANYDTLDSYLADDFTVPAGSDWTVSEVSIAGFYANNLGIPPEKADGFNVIIWSHDASNNTPDAEVYRADNVTPSSDGTSNDVSYDAGAIVLPLASPAQLTPGTYWLTVQANMDGANNSADTRFFWADDAGTFGTPTQLYVVGGGGRPTSVPCNQDWGTNTVCRPATNQNQDPALVFELSGSVVSASEAAAESRTLSLHPTEPNPAADRVRVPFTLRAPADVRLAVYDALGREVAVVSERAYGAGDHAEALDASSLPAGLYVVRLVAGGETVLRTLAVAR